MTPTQITLGFFALGKAPTFSKQILNELNPISLRPELMFNILDSGVSPVLSSVTPEFGTLYMSQSDSSIPGGQIGQLTINSGGELNTVNLAMGAVANSTDTIDMNGTAQATMSGTLFCGMAAGVTATINMNDSSTLSTAGLGWNGGSIVMDGDAVLTVNVGSAAWANNQITAKNAGSGDSIRVTALGGDAFQYDVIPEPATLGLVALMGGALLVARRNFNV